jgi:hypothetical protein
MDKLDACAPFGFVELKHENGVRVTFLPELGTPRLHTDVTRLNRSFMLFRNSRFGRGRYPKNVHHLVCKGPHRPNNLFNEILKKAVNPFTRPNNCIATALYR